MCGYEPASGRIEMHKERHVAGILLIPHLHQHFNSKHMYRTGKDNLRNGSTCRTINEDGSNDLLQLQ